MKWKIEHEEEVYGMRNYHLQCLILVPHYSYVNKSTGYIPR